MVIIDFPGLNAVKDIVGHLKTQKTALSVIPIRMICFIIKYSSRNDDFERELSQMLYIFNSYTSNIAIIISKSEKATRKTRKILNFCLKIDLELKIQFLPQQKLMDMIYVMNLISSKIKWKILNK